MATRRRVRDVREINNIVVLFIRAFRNISMVKVQHFSHNDRT